MTHTERKPLFEKGDEIRLISQPDVQGFVRESLGAVRDTWQYSVKLNGKAQIVYESQIEMIPEDNVGDLTMEELRAYYTARKLTLQNSSSLYSLNTGNIKFIPFQYRPLSKILKADRPRILIADEVGVGKTIETGLIIKEFQKRGAVRTVMVVCPKELTGKWQVEMRKRFDEKFDILDFPALEYCLDYYASQGCYWPHDRRRCIVGMEMARLDRTMAKLLQYDDILQFDMLVVDEAHHVSGNSTRALVEFLANRSNVVVFLSATPLQLRQNDLYTLLNLLLPEDYNDPSVFAQMAAPNTAINAAIRAVRNSRETDWQQQASDALSKIYVNDWAEEAYRDNSLVKLWTSKLQDLATPLSSSERMECMRALESLHSFSHVINRTRRKDIDEEFTKREAITVCTQYSPEETRFYEAVKLLRYNWLVSVQRYSHGTARMIMSTIERMVTSSLPSFAQALPQLIKSGRMPLAELTDDIDIEDDETIDFSIGIQNAEELLNLAKQLPKTDAKAEALLKIIRDTRENSVDGKLLVFSFFTHTLNYLREILSREKVRVGMITGRVSGADRTIIRDRFALDKSDSKALDVLLCSEVGCEGLDYQFCSRMVNYDIPWNPMKIEQRIGRIDRIGQKSDKIRIFNFVTEGTVERRVFFRCAERLGVFQNCIGDLDCVLGEIVYGELQDAFLDMSLTDAELDEKVKKLIDNAILKSQEQVLLEKNAHDLFLLDVEREGELVSQEKKRETKLNRCLLAGYFAKEYPDAMCSLLNDNQLKLKLHKADRAKLLRDLIELWRSTKLFDKNSDSFRKLRRLLEADVSEPLLLDFANGEDKSGDLIISPCHPLLILAQRAMDRLDDSCCEVSFQAHIDGIPAGNYFYTCLSWSESGYRTREDVRAFLYSESEDKGYFVDLNRFEAALLEGDVIDAIPSETSRTRASHFLYEEYLAAKERLEQTNDDIVRRKRATLARHYEKSCQTATRQLSSTDSDLIRLMRESELKNLHRRYTEECSKLDKCLISNIFYSNFVTGTLQVL